MRVITGSAKGRALRTLEGDNVRPTTQRVKEAIFSIIQFDIEGRRVLDLFAGSGQLGIEALSRGAQQAVFVDNEKASVAVIKENLAKTQLAACANVVQTDAFSFLRMNGELFDLAFLDPPYSTGMLRKALDSISDHIATGGLVICECPLDEELDDKIDSLKKLKSYRYGKISVTTFIKQ